MAKANSIGLKLKWARDVSKLSQSEVAEKLAEKGIPISRETLCKIENGNRTISAMELNALCMVLDMDINELFDKEEKDDLVTLFRKKNFSVKTVDEVGKLQDMIKVFINQRKIYNGEFEPQKGKPLWKEC